MEGEVTLDDLLAANAQFGPLDLHLLIAEIIGPSGRVHYRRPVGDPLVAEAERTPGYRVRYVTKETIEPAPKRRGKK